MQTVKQPNNPKQKEGPVTAPLTNGAGAYALNDLYHARKFIEFYAKHVRYCAKLGGFLVWNGKRWTLDKTGQVWRWIVHTAGLAYNADFTGASDHERLRLNKCVKYAETSRSVENTLKQLQMQLEIIAAPDDFDHDPWLFNVNNGTIDLRTGHPREHRPEDFITKITPVDFDPASEVPPVWTRFLTEMFGSNHNLIDFIQRACGYALTGSVTEQKLFFLHETASHGSGANGKTTFLETLMFIMGHYAQPLASELLFTARRHTHPAAFADLKLILDTSKN